MAYYQQSCSNVVTSPMPSSYDYTATYNQYNSLYSFQASTPTSNSAMAPNTSYNDYSSYYYYDNQHNQTSPAFSSTLYNDASYYGSSYGQCNTTDASQNDSAYVSQTASHNSYSHIAYDVTNIQPVKKQRKRKQRDDDCCSDDGLDPKCTKQIVEQIFTDAAVAQLHHIDVNDGKKSKRPKIYKLDIGTEKINGEKLCAICNLTFNSHAKLLMHQYKYHSNGNSTECPICFKKFGNQANTLVHLRAHTQEKTYNCTYCDHSFCDSSTLKKHLRVHTGDKPYECNVCLKKFSQSGNLKRHMTVHIKYPVKVEQQFQFVTSSPTFSYNN